MSTTTRPACFNDSTPLGRIWSAGVLPTHSAKDRIPLLTPQILQDCHEIIHAALAATQAGTTPAPKHPQNDNPLLLLFTNPRITGTILLGLCKILYWNIEGFGEQIKSMLQKVIEQNTVQPHPRHAAALNDCDDDSVAERRKRRPQRTRRPPPTGSEGGTGGPTEDQAEDTESEHGSDEEYRESSAPGRSRTHNLASAAEPARKLLQLLERRPAQLDMSWLCHPQAENLMSLLQSEMDSSLKSGPLADESMMDEEDAGDDVVVEDEGDDISAFFAGGSSPSMPALPALSPTVAAPLGVTPTRSSNPVTESAAEDDYDQEEVVFAHPLTARPQNDGGASVRLKRRSEFEQPEEEILYSDRLAGQTGDEKAPLTQGKVGKKEALTKEKRLLPMWDNVISVTEHRLVEGSGCLEYPARTFDWRASTAVPCLWLPFTAAMCRSVEDRFLMTIKLKNLQSKQFSWGDDDGSVRPEQSNTGGSMTDAMRDLPILTPLHPGRRHRDSEMSFDNLDSSVVDSSEKPGTADFADRMGSISSSNDLSSILRLVGAAPSEAAGTPAEQPVFSSPLPFESVGSSGEPLPHAAPSVGSRGTVTSAESAYEVNTWTLRCFIGKLLHNKAAATLAPVEEVHTTFSEIIPPNRCTRMQAAITLKHILVLATAGDLRLYQKDPTDNIEIRMGRQSRVGAVPATSSEASDSLVSFNPGKRPADAVACGGESAKRRRTDF